MAKSRRNKRKFISLLAVIICLSITSLVFGGGKINILTKGSGVYKITIRIRDITYWRKIHIDTIGQ